MKKIFLLLAFLIMCITHIVICQPSQTLVATVSGGVASLSVSEQTLIDALEEELNDGTTVNRVEIKYYTIGQTWYIFALGIKGADSLAISWDLRLTSSNLYVNNSSVSTNYTICIWIQCDNCGSTPAECPESCPEGKGHGPEADCMGSTPQKSTTDGHIGSFY
jgi:hypothetical protein